MIPSKPSLDSTSSPEDPKLQFNPEVLVERDSFSSFDPVSPDQDSNSSTEDWRQRILRSLCLSLLVPLWLMVCLIQEVLVFFKTSNEHCPDFNSEWFD